MKRIVNTIKQFKLKDLMSPIIFVVMFLPSLFFRLINKLKHRRLWLVAEEGDVRDNGYHFYKYIRKNHPNDFCFYAVNPKSAGYKKVAKLGNVIKYGGLKHWLYYMSANLNISSQKSGNPAPIFWYVMHVTFGLYRNRVFLQHGVIKDDLKFAYYNCAKFKYFICGAKREYDYVLKKFGYTKDNLIFSGLPRWDSLNDVSSKQKNKSILIMPTWREWLGGEKNKLFTVKDFLNTEYYKKWSALLNGIEFIEFIEKNNMNVYFYPHINMQAFLKYFKASSRNIKIISCENDIQKYFNTCDLMITDYSSVAFDFAYLKKPVIYYQFDLEQYRKKQYQEGYFSYRKDGFGPIFSNPEDIIKTIDKVKKDREKYEKRCDNFFLENDFKNCERIFNILNEREGAR